MSLPSVLKVRKLSCGIAPRLAYASVRRIEKQEPNIRRKSPEVSIFLALVENGLGTNIVYWPDLWRTFIVWNFLMRLSFQALYTTTITTDRRNDDTGR
ncbi:MAG: hypothetical protein ACREAQ_08790, partial [Nitrososphaera sp.]